jgi:hypothetical protein
MHVKALVAVFPAVLAMAASVWMVAGWVGGGAPFFADPHMTVSEAAGLASAGEVVRLVTHEHRDPSAAAPVRDGILGAPQTVTPLEAAVAIRRVEMVRVLIRLGAVPRTDDERTGLICRAAASGDDALVSALVATGDGSDPRPACTAAR